LSSKTRVIFVAGEESQPSGIELAAAGQSGLRPLELANSVPPDQNLKPKEEIVSAPHDRSVSDGRSAAELGNQVKIPKIENKADSATRALHPIDPEVKAETLERFIEQYPNSIAREKTFEQLL